MKIVYYEKVIMKKDNGGTNERIIFDVDGTLWDSTREVAVAWNKVLQDEMEGQRY